MKRVTKLLCSVALMFGLFASVSAFAYDHCDSSDPSYPQPVYNPYDRDGGYDRDHGGGYDRDHGGGYDRDGGYGHDRDHRRGSFVCEARSRNSRFSFRGEGFNRFMAERAALNNCRYSSRDARGCFVTFCRQEGGRGHW